MWNFSHNNFIRYFIFIYKDLKFVKIISVYRDRKSFILKYIKKSFWTRIIIKKIPKLDTKPTKQHTKSTHNLHSEKLPSPEKPWETQWKPDDRKKLETINNRTTNKQNVPMFIPSTSALWSGNIIPIKNSYKSRWQLTLTFSHRVPLQRYPEHAPPKKDTRAWQSICHQPAKG